MHSESESLDLLSNILKAAKSAGATAADAVFVGGESVSVSVLRGEVEDITRSEDAEIGLRAFVGDRNASVALSSFSAAAMTEAAKRAVAMAKAASADDYAGLASPDLLATDLTASLDLDDGRQFDLERVEREALRCEAATLAVDGVTQPAGAGAQAGRSSFAFATSTGFSGARTGSTYGHYAAVIAGEGGAMQRDYAQSSARHLADLEDAETVGRRAGERTVARLSPIPMTSGAMPVIFDKRVSATLLGHLVAAISGAAIARGSSFLEDPEAKLFAEGIDIIDDPTRVRGERSRTFDGEGLPTAKRKIVDGGRLTGWLVNVAAGKQLGLEPTGHAVRGTSGPPGVGTTNLHLAAGTTSRDDMLAAVDRGVLVTELIGQGVNGVTGDYSRGASGFLIEKGKIVGPVSEITVAGNLKSMFAALTPANDLEFRHATNAPTLRIDGMTVAGG